MLVGSWGLFAGLGVGILLALAGWRWPWIVRDWRYLLLSFAGLLFNILLIVLALIRASADHPTEDVEGRMVILISVLAYAAMMAILWVPILSESGGEVLVGALPRWMMSDHKLKDPLTFDKGDTALKAGDPAKALVLYRAELARHPGEPDTHLRMAEAHRTLGDGEGVCTCLAEAARLALDPHRRGPILIQLSERRALDGKREMARGVLEGILSDPALSSYHVAARNRLASVR